MVCPTLEIDNCSWRNSIAIFSRLRILSNCPLVPFTEVELAILNQHTVCSTTTTQKINTEYNIFQLLCLLRKKTRQWGKHLVTLGSDDLKREYIIIKIKFKTTIHTSSALNCILQKMLSSVEKQK